VIIKQIIQPSRDPGRMECRATSTEGRWTSHKRRSSVSLFEDDVAPPSPLPILTPPNSPNNVGGLAPGPELPQSPTFAFSFSRSFIDFPPAPTEDGLAVLAPKDNDHKSSKLAVGLTVVVVGIWVTFCGVGAVGIKEGAVGFIEMLLN